MRVPTFRENCKITIQKACSTKEFKKHKQRANMGSALGPQFATNAEKRCPGHEVKKGSELKCSSDQGG